MEFKKNIFFIILMLGLLMVYLPVGNMALPDRALMLVSVVISVLLLRSVYCSQFFVSLYLKKNITTGFLVTNIVLLSLLLKVYFELHVFNQSRMRMLDALRLRNITVAELPGYNKSGFIESLVVFNDITIDKTAWQNQCFSSYYQFKESVLD